MPNLTAEQTKIIELQIHEAIKDKQLRAELTDHVCCAVEKGLSEGHHFEKALIRAMNDLDPCGVAALEQELLFLLTLQTPIIMKKLLYGCGFIAATGIASGLLFRQFLWPGGAVLMCVGCTALWPAMLTLIYQLIKFPGIMPMQSRIRLIAGAMSGLLIASGTIFKIQSFPTANIQVGLGMAVLIVVFIPLFFWELYQRELRSSH
jgi:hypothetical protein